jgi:alanine racemase
MQPVLTVDLAALRANYRLLKQRHAKTDAAAVVKANAYGLGVEAVSKALWDEGCREFFVATLEEGVELRHILPDAVIGVFNGLHHGQEQDFLHHHLLPVLNELPQLERWQRTCADAKAILHIDSGMTRLGFTHGMLETAVKQHNEFCQKHIALLMSHLACANEPEHPKNNEQLTRFNAAKALLPGVRTSLCNSSGFFLDHRFHQDVGRPGCALYGITPTEHDNPMQHVATLSAPILQIRTLDRDETVGYGATYPALSSSKIAITALGYADGWLRSQSNNGYAYIGSTRVPIAGRVSMDMVALDVSTLSDAQLNHATQAEFICKAQPVDHIAKACNTIGYEIFTRLGRRILRHYHS